MYKHYPMRPKKLTASFARKEYAGLLEQLPEAEVFDTASLWLELFAQWNELKSYIGSEASRIGFRYSQNMFDKVAEAEDRYLREKLAPAVEDPEHRLTLAFLASRHREAIAKKYGQQLIPTYETDVKPSDPININQRIAAGRLAQNYEKKIAGAMVSIQGQKMTLWKSRAYYQSPDEAVRKEAFLANRGWFLSHRVEMASIYDQLVKLRQKMAENVGYKNFIPFAYESLGRTDYDAAMVGRFRANVKKYAVPLNRTLAGKRAEALGKLKLKPWDAYDPRTTLPMGIMSVESQLGNAQLLFDKLSPELGKHFKKMRRLGLIELENRPGKRSGAYCTEFSDEEKVLIFCNSTGDADDLESLTHEMGHAFQGWESQSIEAVDLQWGTLDLCEVFSTGMEFLSLPHIDEFLSEEHAKKFRIGRWEQSISMLCYVCVVDEFQHWVYENPKMTAQARDDTWYSLVKEYMAPIDDSGYEPYQKARWYGQGHIFVSPFYYIDYALAETCALQLALLASEDRQNALDVYLKMCRIGGTKSFLEAIRYGGMRSPFDEPLMKELMVHAAKQVGL